MKRFLAIGLLVLVAACGEAVAPPQNGAYGPVVTSAGNLKPHTTWTRNWTPTPYNSPANPQR